jgi:hypothetical protein
MGMHNLNEILLLQKETSTFKSCSLKELEALLNFQYLQKLTFSPEEKILEKGLQKYQKGDVLQEHLLLGKKFEKEIQDGLSPQVSVRFCQSGVGFGLFAEEDLEEDIFVGEYTGLVRKNNDYLKMNDYLYSYPVEDSIGRNYVIDATNGNLMRFVNHSFWPNLKPSYAFIDGIYHVILVTIMPIQKGRQLTYDYGRNYWYVRSSPCSF